MNLSISMTTTKSGPSGGDTLTVTCFTCGMPSSKEWAQKVRTQPSSPPKPYFPFLATMSGCGTLGQDGGAWLCAFCHASLEAQWENYERAKNGINSRKYSVHKFICAVCSVETYRKRVRALPFQEFPFLAKQRASGSLTLGNNPLAVVCLDCSETLWAQSAEYDRWGLPVHKRHFNWMARPPPPEDSVEATVARLPSGETQLPRCPPIEPIRKERMESLKGQKRTHKTSQSSFNSDHSNSGETSKSSKPFTSVGVESIGTQHTQPPVVTVAPMSTQNTFTNMRKETMSVPPNLVGMVGGVGGMTSGTSGNFYPRPPFPPYSSFTPWREGMNEMFPTYQSLDLHGHSAPSPWPWMGPHPPDLFRYNSLFNSMQNRSFNVPDPYYNQQNVFNPSGNLPGSSNSLNSGNSFMAPYLSLPPLNMPIINPPNFSSPEEPFPKVLRVSSSASKEPLQVHQASSSNSSSRIKSHSSKTHEKLSIKKQMKLRRETEENSNRENSTKRNSERKEVKAENDSGDSPPPLMKKKAYIEKEKKKKKNELIVPKKWRWYLNHQGRKEEERRNKETIKDKVEKVSSVTIKSESGESSCQMTFSAPGDFPLNIKTEESREMESNLNEEVEENRGGNKFSIAYLCQMSPNSEGSSGVFLNVSTNLVPNDENLEGKTVFEQPEDENQIAVKEKKSDEDEKEEIRIDPKTYVRNAIEEFKKKEEEEKKLIKEEEKKKNEFLKNFDLVTSQEKNEIELKILIHREEKGSLQPLKLRPTSPQELPKLGGEFEKLLLQTAFDDPSLNSQLKPSAKKLAFVENLGLKPASKSDKSLREQTWRLLLTDRLLRGKRNRNYRGIRRLWDNFTHISPSLFFRKEVRGEVGPMKALSLTLPPEVVGPMTSSSDLLTTVEANSNSPEESTQNIQSVISYPKYVPSYANDIPAIKIELDENLGNEEGILRVPQYFKMAQVEDSLKTEESSTSEEYDGLNEKSEPFDHSLIQAHLAHWKRLKKGMCSLSSKALRGGSENEIECWLSDLSTLRVHLKRRRIEIRAAESELSALDQQLRRRLSETKKYSND